MMMAVEALILVAGLADGGNVPTAIHVLRGALGSSVEYVVKPSPTIRYCPDNTCVAIEGSQKARPEDVADFALLYFWYVDGYTYLKEWKGAPQPPDVALAIARRAPVCSDETAAGRAACALRNLAKSARIKLWFIRYDEGHRSQDPISLDDELKRIPAGKGDAG